ncbi:MAG TPA: hypothetical protein VKP30_32840 [Polyangiaceae bacterium]|nr:hypothetical protein [Polyangiaceae bacterium]
MNRAILLGALTLIVGCGGEETHPPNVPPESNGGRESKGGQTGVAGTVGGHAALAGNANAAGSATTNGGTTSMGSAAGGSAAGNGAIGGGLNLNPAAPIVTITSPVGTLDLNDVDHVIVKDLIDVTCKAEAASLTGSTVNVGTTSVVMFEPASTAAVSPTSTTPLPTGVTARFNLSDVPSGWVTLQCTAQDSSSVPLTGTSAPLKVLVDHGPTITFSAPAKDQPWALKNPLNITFAVTPTSFSASDTFAGTDSVVLLIDGHEVPVAETTPGSGNYSSTVSLSDPKIFPMTDIPSGSTTVRAVVTNKRKAVADSGVTINVDSTPPVVTVTSPTDGSVVGGELQLKFNVKDPASTGTNDPGSGVKAESTVVKLNYAPFPYDSTSERWSFDKNSGDFIFRFRESDLASSTAQATIGISAGDLAGNAETAARSLTLYIDRVPPVVDLDPPTVRELYIDSDRLTHGSNSFDPLGEAVNDRAIVQGAAIFRAFVWDRTNTPLPGSNIEKFAATNQSTVRLWMQEEVTRPLLKDTNGDGVCDAIDEGSAIAPAIAIELRAIPTIGTSPRMYNAEDKNGDNVDDTFYIFEDARYWDVPALLTGQHYPLKNLTVPDRLCANTSDMVRVTQHSMEVSPAEPVVYGLTPSASGVGCTGVSWEFTGLLHRTVPEGWVCFAAEATDNVGNVGISPVMALCYDDLDGTNGVPSCSTVKKPDPTSIPPWGSLSASRSSENPSCALSCTLPKVDPVRSIVLR